MKQVAIADLHGKGGFLTTQDSSPALKSHIPGKIYADVQDCTGGYRYVRQNENTRSANIHCFAIYPVRHGICTKTHGKFEREPLSSIQM
jgi:hypothetical protein